MSNVAKQIIAGYKSSYAETHNEKIPLIVL